MRGFFYPNIFWNLSIYDNHTKFLFISNHYLYLAMKKILFVLVFMTFAFNLKAQSLTGTNGLFKIPSAYIAPDGQSYIGASFYPKGYYDLYSSGDRFTGMPTFVSLSLYDRIEFTFRYTHQLGQKINNETKYFPDRMFILRYNFLKEGSYHPAITLGLHDVSEALGGTSATPWFLATYLVASKTFESKSLTIYPTLGYSFDLISKSNNMVFNGFFAGIELTVSQFPYFSFIGEYDSDSINVALKTTALGHFHFSIGLLDMQALAGFFTYRFNLSN